MKKKNLLRKVIVTTIVFAMFLQISGCGYLMYPERRGQPKGKIDVSVALLDGLGLLVFLIPGIIAFAVDFTKNTIYLPPGRSSINNNTTDEMITLRIPKQEFNKEGIEQIVREHSGLKIDLASNNVYIYAANDTDEVRNRIISQ
ncbi:MAG: hypothetical protein JRJ02_11660 [Deltaproteobacteria bacterium]|nr:hypothetical protein [Deltaproteobacteria bacterium]